jgi:hypothetical protein
MNAKWGPRNICQVPARQLHANGNNHFVWHGWLSTTPLAFSDDNCILFETLPRE